MAERPACPGLERVHRATNLAELLLDAPPAWRERPMLRRRLPDGSWARSTRGQVQQAVRRVSAWLQAQGIRPSDRVGILSHNKPEWLIADFAILAIGAVTVPAYFTDPEEAVAHVFMDAGVSLILVEPGEQRQKLAGLDGVPIQPLIGEGETLAAVAADAAWDGRFKPAMPDRDDMATLMPQSPLKAT